MLNNAAIDLRNLPTFKYLELQNAAEAETEVNKCIRNGFKIFHQQVATSWNAEKQRHESCFVIIMLKEPARIN